MKKTFLFLFTILKFVGKTLSTIRIFFLNIIILTLLAVIFIPFYSPKDPVTQPNSTLLLTITGNIVEEKQAIDPFSEVLNEVLGSDGLPQETLLQDVLDAITHGAYDDHIITIVLDLKDMRHVGLNQLHDIGMALEKFKATGKQVIAAEDFYTQNQYYLASFASKIIINPMGGVDLHGFGIYRLYFKDALEKLRINYHVFKVGTYKSAIEPLTRNTMSEPDKEQNKEWLTSLWQNFVQNTTSRRKLPTNTIDQYTNNIPSELALTGGDTAELALNKGFVDEIKTREEIRSYLASLTGPEKHSGFRHITLKNYLKTIEHTYAPSNNSENKIGIIVAQGTILHGKRPPGTIGGDSLARLIRQARNDSRVKGIVLRIDSGGGSVFASEVIRQELLSLKKSGKSFVASMSTIAASGGYWIAANADEIWASPTTITGSIGIFGAIPTFEKTLSHFGIYRDGIGTTALSSGLDLTQPLSPLIEETIQLTLNHGYEQFISIVKEGRQLNTKMINRYAQGRVFDGKKALDIGLVDNLGNLADAVKAAARIANLDSYSAEYIQTPYTLKDRFLQHFTAGCIRLLGVDNGFLNFLQKMIQSLYPFKDALLFNDPSGLYAHCMIFEID